LSFTSQHGLVSVASLPVVAVDGRPHAAAQPVRQEPPPPLPRAADRSSDGDIFATIEKLAALRAKGILTEEEFAAKKTELLSRL
jgi:hypothetical protein